MARPPRHRDATRRLCARAGYGHGHRAGLLLENRPAFFLHWFALNALGVSVVPINPDLRAAELEYLAGHSEIALAVALPGRHADLQAAAAGRELRVMGPDDAPPAAPFAAPLAGSEPGELSECALLYRPAPPAGPRAASCPTAISCTPAAGARAWAAWPLCARPGNAC